MHDDDFTELQQQFTEAKLVIKQLAAQLDHYSNIQQQLAGLHTLHLAHRALPPVYCMFAVVLHRLHPSCSAHPYLAGINNSLAMLALAAQLHCHAAPIQKAAHMHAAPLPIKVCYNRTA